MLFAPEGETVSLPANIETSHGEENKHAEGLRIRTFLNPGAH